MSLKLVEEVYSVSGCECVFVYTCLNTCMSYVYMYNYVCVCVCVCVCPVSS